MYTITNVTLIKPIAVSIRTILYWKYWHFGAVFSFLTISMKWTYFFEWLYSLFFGRVISTGGHLTWFYSLTAIEAEMLSVIQQMARSGSPLFYEEIIITDTADIHWLWLPTTVTVVKHDPETKLNFLARILDSWLCKIHFWFKSVD